MRLHHLTSLALAMALVLPGAAQAFTGLYVSKTQTPLTNHASKIVVARHDTRTVLTIAADFQGDASKFAMLIPVPGPVTRGQINITENRIIDQLDAYTAPRLSEYYDDDPCLTVYSEKQPLATAIPMGMMVDSGMAAQSRGVTVEEQFAAGEYDVTILTATQSRGLVAWLAQTGYVVPAASEDMLDGYIKDGMQFFVATVNLLAYEKNAEKAGFHYLRPLQVAYESEKLILPLQLGTLNASAPQDMLLFTLTQKGRVEPANYRTVNMPTGEDVPLYVGSRFDEFYNDMFARQAEKEDMKAVFLEYAWDMAWCDPCTAEPLPQADLITLGAWWLERPDQQPVSLVKGFSGPNTAVPLIAPAPSPVNVFVTRMHMRYTPETVGEDMALEVTDNRENFQARYIMRQPWTNDASCDQAGAYYESLPQRFEKEAQTLSSLTGWNVDSVRAEMKAAGQPFDIQPQTDTRPWWEQMWEEQGR